MGGRRRRRGAVLAGTVAAAVLASGIGLWAADGRPAVPGQLLLGGVGAEQRRAVPG
ncbi:hypothetical protein [Streptomyces atratus]|uniref:hypothetical protein n=1 Tax=Streptomyces atratus TaxID=1893 RepID=UPI0021A467AE|nr:hypothetical protein [Streptomyces atratus]MCT2543768.1 hypothetical protein [Streptomyces atratus]